MAVNRKRRRDPVPLVLSALLVAAVALTAFGPRTDTPTARAKVPVLSDEAAAFRESYGAPQYSSHNEELFVRDFFQNRRNGFFVDVGASDARVRSNTYYLERELGWSGLAIDPIQDFAAGYAVFRPKTRFLPLFVSDKSDETATLFIGDNSLFSSADQTFTDRFTAVKRAVESPTITLDDLLSAQKVTGIDFLSIDIELHEPEALAGFDASRWKPALVCIEAHPEVRQAILDYFHRHRYVVLGKYLRADPQNLWFAPASR